MINENALRDALLALALELKTNYLTTTALVHEVAALRETVRGLDPTFADLLEQKRQESAQAAAKVEKAVIWTLDELMRRLTVGEVC